VLSNQPAVGNSQIQETVPENNKSAKKKRVVVIGRKPVERSTNDNCTNDETLGVIAAAPRFRKSVYCVDNVSKQVTAKDLEAYIKRLQIQVITIHEVQTRLNGRERREGTNPADLNRRAFRVCINREDADKMIDPNNWYNSVAVSAWFFKPPKDTENAAESDHDAKKMRSDSITDEAAAVAGDGCSVTDPRDYANDY
jgi:hypothetical protein